MGNSHIKPGTRDPADLTTFLVATSGGIDLEGKTRVALYWPANRDAVGYNLYRRHDVKGSRWVHLNDGQPIRPVATCAELKAVVKMGSPEWQMLSDALASVGVKEQLKVVKGPKDQPHLVLGTEAAILNQNVTLATVKVAKVLAVAAKDPCELLAQGLTAEQVAIWDVLAAANLTLRQTRGLAYIDRTVVADNHYVYELRAVSVRGEETVLASGLEVHAGHYILPGPPSDLLVAAGDCKVLVTWNRHQKAYDYLVRRSENVAGAYQAANAEPVVYDVEHDLAGNDLTPRRPGFVDFQRWDADGLPAAHDVNGVNVEGPANGTTYYYKVASRDAWGRAGAWSAAVAATPADATPPMAPDGFRIDPCLLPAPGLVLSWRKVTRDVQNHQERDISQTYRIYRADNSDSLIDAAVLSAHQVHVLTANPSDPAGMVLSWTDTDPLLVPPFGEQDFWYLVKCVDAAGNVGEASAQISGRVPDTRPPGGTKVIDADGFADHVRVGWDLNTEPDVAGYQIWRSVCDYGQPFQPREQGEKKLGCDFMLVGDVSKVNAEKQVADAGNAYLDDYSVPPGSPLCYAYWVRAYDASANLFEGDHGCPSEAWQYVCQRLYEETPPPTPIIKALKARNNAVLIEWIASPVQDLRAFHIYRGKTEFDPPEFIGCVLSDGTLRPDGWKGMAPSCEDIPAEPNPDTVHGAFLDESPEPSQVYWYRVSALDWLGNESEGDDLLQIPAISTFTYTRDLPAAPVLLRPGGSPAVGCGLVVSWDPLYDSSLHQGFVLFRSGAAGGPYRQVSPLVTANSYADVSALRGVDYWYCAQTVDTQERLSPPSAPVKFRY